MKDFMTIDWVCSRLMKDLWISGIFQTLESTPAKD